MVALRSFEFDNAGAMFRRSARSKQFAAQYHGVDLDASAFTNGEAEFSMATPALLCLVSLWASQPSTKEGSDAVRQQAEKFLDGAWQLRDEDQGGHDCDL